MTWPRRSESPTHSTEGRSQWMATPRSSARGRTSSMQSRVVADRSNGRRFIGYCPASSLANSSNAFSVFTDCPAFSLNILRSDDHSVAHEFSRRGGDRIIPPAQFSMMETGAPVLTSALASLDCRMRLRQPMGDHEVIYGDVVAYRADPGVDALGFFRGRFVTLRSED